MAQQNKIWLNGRWLENDKAGLPLLTHGLHYGTGFFEGIRSYVCEDGRSAVFQLQAHIKRLFNSAKITDITIPYTEATLNQVVVDLLKMNGIKQGYIRPIVYYGTGSLGLLPANNSVEVAIACWEWGAYLGQDALRKGISTKVSSFPRYRPNTALANAKITGNYMLSVMAKREAVKLGYQEAIMLDNDGFVAEGSAENIFIVSEGQLITPPRQSILPGITRASIMRLAQEKGISVVEEHFTRDRLYIADEAFFTGTAAEVTPIASVDDRPIGSGKPGEMTKMLQKAYFKAITGESLEHQDWLTYYDVS